MLTFSMDASFRVSDAHKRAFLFWRIMTPQIGGVHSIAFNSRNQHRRLCTLPNRSTIPQSVQADLRDSGYPGCGRSRQAIAQSRTETPASACVSCSQAFALRRAMHRRHESSSRKPRPPESQHSWHRAAHARRRLKDPVGRQRPHCCGRCQTARRRTQLKPCPQFRNAAAWPDWRSRATDRAEVCSARTDTNDPGILLINTSITTG